MAVLTALLLLIAHAEEPRAAGLATTAEPVYEAAWVLRDDSFVARIEPGTWRVVELSGDPEVRLTCAAPAGVGVRPERRQLHIDGQGVVAIDGGPWPAPVIDAGSWVFPPRDAVAAATPPGLDTTWWAFSDASCAVEVRQRTIAGGWLDRVEHDAPSIVALRARVEDARLRTPDEQLAWDVLPDARWWDRWVALRPPSPFVPTVGSLRTDRRATLREGGGEDTLTPWAADESTTLHVRGPVRVHLLARPERGEGPVCMSVDGAVQDCAEGAPLVRLVPGPDTSLLVDDGCRAAAVGLTGADTPRIGFTPDTTPPCTTRRRIVRWDLWLPPGPHTLSFDGDLALGGTLVDVTPVRAVAPLPDHVVVVRERGRVPLSTEAADPTARDGAAAEDDQDDEQRQPVGPSLPLPTVVLTGPVWTRPTRPTDVSWIDPSRVEGTQFVEPDGSLRLWLRGVPTLGLPCSLDAPGGHVWTSAPPDGPVRLLSLDPTRPPATPPDVSGCTARVRVTGPLPPGVTREVTRAFWTLPAETWVPFPITSAEGAQVRVALPVSPGTLPRSHQITVRDATGEELRWRVAAAAGTARWSDPSGRLAASLAVLELDRLVAPVEVRVDRDTWVSIVERGAGPATAEEVVDTTPIDEARLRASAAAVAGAPDDLTRLDALRAHARLLERAGDPRGAIRDASLADPGADPDVLFRNALLRTIHTDVLTTGGQVPDGAWIPVGPTWIDAALLRDPSRLDEAVAAAARGDAITVARSLRPPEDARWWARAARTQPLTADAAMAAWLSASATPELLERTDLGAARAWSRWIPVRAIGGTVGWRAPWPVPDWDDDALFPEAWPAERRVPVGDGWLVRLPATSAATTIQVRCRALDPRAASAPCTVRRVAPDGRVLDVRQLAPWGSASVLDVPPTRVPTFVELASPGAVHAEVLLPEGMRYDPNTRDVRRVTDPSSVTADVLGPTSLRVEAHDPDRADAPVAVCVPTDDGSERCWHGVLVDGRMDVAVPVPELGTRRVRLRVATGTLLRLSVRTPDEATITPLDQRVLLGELLVPADPLVRVEAPVPVVVPPPVRRRELPLAVAVGVRAGLAGDADEDVEATGGFVVRGRPSVSVSSRPLAAPWWVEAGVAMYADTGVAPVVEGSLGTEVWWSGAPWRGWFRADGVLRSETVASGEQSMRGAAELGLSLRPRALVDWRLAVSADGASRLEPAGTPWLVFGRDDISDVVWSTFRDDHRLQGKLRTELRLFPTPWIRVRLHANTRTNAPHDNVLLDGVTGGLDLRFAIPSVRFDVGGGVDHRLRDENRIAAYTTPFANVAVEGIVWSGPRLGLLLGADGAWRLEPQTLTVGGRITLLWLGRPGLGDVRPSAMDARPALEWAAKGRFVDR